MNIGALLDSRVTLVLEEINGQLSVFQNGIRAANIIGREAHK